MQTGSVRPANPARDAVKRQVLQTRGSPVQDAAAMMGGGKMSALGRRRLQGEQNDRSGNSDGSSNKKENVEDLAREAYEEVQRMIDANRLRNGEPLR